MAVQTHIIVVTGVMASGKSTVAQAIARLRPPGVHLRGGFFRRMIVSGRVDMTPTPSPEALRQLKLRHELAAQAASAYCRSGFNVVVQDNIIGSMLPYFLGLLDGLPVRVVVLCPSPAAVAAREAAREKKGYGGFAVDEMHALFVRDTPRLGLWLDSSDWSVDETVRAVMRDLDDPGGLSRIGRL